MHTAYANTVKPLAAHIYIILCNMSADIKKYSCIDFLLCILLIARAYK